MPLAWNITDDEVAKVKTYVSSRADDGLVKFRIRQNLIHRPKSFDPAGVWHKHLYCLLTTQQKSGPNSPATNFIELEPFPLSLDKCRASSDVRKLVFEELTKFGGIRRTNKVADEAKGFGPKQARNLLQMLGLTRYEIPLDSRVVKWFNDFGFGVTIDIAELSYTGPYERLMDKIIELCKRADIYPCVLDAAAFASFDGDGWNRRQ